jgi:hypothetical protein
MFLNVLANTNKSGLLQEVVKLTSECKTAAVKRALIAARMNRDVNTDSLYAQHAGAK